MQRVLSQDRTCQDRMQCRRSRHGGWPALESPSFSVLPGPPLFEGFVDMLSDEVKRFDHSVEQVATDVVVPHRSYSIIQRAAIRGTTAH